MSRLSLASSSSRARRRTAALVVGAAVLLAACSGSSDAGSSSTTAPGGKDGGAKATSTTAAPADDDAYAAPEGEQATSKPIPSSGCGSSTVGTVTAQKEFLDDSDRWFLLTTPTDIDADTPLPLVLDFHGLMEGADIHAKMSDLPTFGQENGFIVVNPNGTGNPIHWEINPDPSSNDDLAYTTSMLDQLEAELCVDTSRVYSTGLSNGAMFSSVLGCAMSDRIVAIAPVSGVQHPKPCEPGRPVPVLAFHGTDDPILLFNGGVGPRLNQIMTEGVDKVGEGPTDLPAADVDGPGYPATAQEWADTNGCTGDPTDDQLTDTVTVRTWDCPADGATEFVIIDGGGHSWPGSEFSKALKRVMGPTDDSIVANELIWDFFQRFSLPPS